MQHRGLLFHLENISHAGRAAGWWGWEGSSLLLLLVGIFSLRALKFAASSSVEIGL